jgi:small-conductance mechanosensitive channel
MDPLTERLTLIVLFIAIAGLVVMGLFLPPAPSLGLGFLAMLAIGVLIGTYFLPSVIAFSRGHQHSAPILLLNLFLGWTLVGWVAALVWAAMPVSATPCIRT